MKDKDISEYDFIEKATDAWQRIQHHIRETPLEFSPYLSQISGSMVYLKLENLQQTGSFKFRGAVNFISSLSRPEMDRGIVTASTGNHAKAVAGFLSKTNIKGSIYVPENAVRSKTKVLSDFDIALNYVGKDVIETEKFARETAIKNGQIYIPPYNHLKIIAGQATVAVELEKQLEQIDAVFVPVGGGGLISGIAGYLKQRDSDVKIIGCQPIASPVMCESVKAGNIVEMISLPTLADGTAGGIEPGSVTFDFCKKLVDGFILVEEAEIQEAMQLVYDYHQQKIEGAAALSVASFLKACKSYKNKNVVLIIS